MNILFVHQNFPGQFKHLAPALAYAGHEVRALAITGVPMEGVGVRNYKPPRGTCLQAHPWVHDVETKFIRGETCAATAEQMAQAGYRPDLIIGHPGWGEMLFLKDLWPGVRQLHFLEFFYSPGGSDVAFDPEFAKSSWRDNARVRAKNAAGLMNLELMDAAYSPTQWQRQSYPGWAHERIKVVHDGIDTDLLTPADAQLRVGPDGPTLHRGMEIVTFVNRNLEPYRGYHIFMRALPLMQRLRPNAHFVLVGGDGVSYGSKPPEGTSWKQLFQDEVKDQLDLSRVHFVGTIRYNSFVSLMRISAAHVYLTYPFVLSWSMLEAMSCGALVIGSDTPPVREVIEDGVNGVLVNFFDTEGLAHRVADALAAPERYQGLRAAARQTVVDRYDLKRVCLPQQLALVDSLLR